MIIKNKKGIGYFGESKKEVDNMTIIKPKREVFYPNCERIEDGTIKCEPVLERDNITLKAEEPVILKPTASGDLTIIKGKGLSEELLDRLVKHIEHRKIL